MLAGSARERGEGDVGTRRRRTSHVVFSPATPCFLDLSCLIDLKAVFARNLRVTWAGTTFALHLSPNLSPHLSPHLSCHRPMAI